MFQQQITIRKGERAKVLSRFSNSLPQRYRLIAEPLDPDDKVSGTIEVKGSRWLFPKPPMKQELKRDNVVTKGVWDTFYSVHVTPDSNVKVSYAGKTTENKALFITLVSLVAIAAFMVLTITFVR